MACTPVRMAAFSVRILVQKSSTRLFYYCARQRHQKILRNSGFFNPTLGTIQFYLPIRNLSKVYAETGIADHELESGFVSDDEPQKRRKSQQMIMIHETLCNNPHLTEDEIYNFRSQIISNGNAISESNVDAIVIGMCSSLRNLDFANKYLHALEKNNIEINAATSGRYLRLCYFSGKIKDELKILQICHNLRKKFPLMDASTAENVIHGLSVTSEWRQGLELIEMIKETSTPSGSTYSALVIAAFKNNEIELGWNLMEECIKEGRILQDLVYMVILDLFCIDSSVETSIEPLVIAEKLLAFLSLHELRPSLNVTKKIKYAFGRMGWRGYFTSISERGKCKSCQADMPPILISRSEFNTLSKTFLEKVLVGPDVFSKSLPEEVEDFQKLIADEAPFNTVIDGLNVAYSAGGKAPPHKCAALLQSVVAHFVDLSHKILVLGRTHMNSWPQREMQYIRENSKLFLTQNLSQDDPFLLYATMSSGPGTCFLSRDLMRSHAHRLKLADPSLSGVFNRWQLSHQMRLVGITYNKRVDIKYPLEYSPTVQKINENWHIPYNEEDQQPNPAEGKKFTPLTQSHLDPPSNWLCLSKSNYREKPKSNYGTKNKYYKSNKENYSW